MASEMNTAVQTGTGFSPQQGLIRDVYSAEVWLSAMPVMKFDLFTTRKTELGLTPGRAIVMQKMGNLKRGGTLTEGQRIQMRALSTSSTTISVAEKGNAVGFTEEMIRSSFVEVYSAASVLLGRDMALVLDLDLRNAGLQTPNTIYANGRTARSQLLIGDILDTATIRRGVEVLDTNNTPRWGDYLVCFIHPHQASNLRSDDDWTAAHVYGNQEALYRGEIGMWEGVRFVISAVMPNGASLALDANGDYVNLGADPNLALGVAGNQVAVYKALLFGEAAIAHAIGAPVEMRDNGNQDFGREHGIAWYGRWGSGVYESGNSVVIETA